MDSAPLVKLFAIIGKEMGEGSLGPSLSDTEKETVNDQVKTLRDQISAAQAKGDSKTANQLYQKEQALLGKINQKIPIVGAQGRRA